MDAAQSQPPPLEKQIVVTFAQLCAEGISRDSRGGDLRMLAEADVARAFLTIRDLQHGTALYEELLQRDAARLGDMQLAGFSGMLLLGAVTARVYPLFDRCLEMAERQLAGRPDYLMQAHSSILGAAAARNLVRQGEWERASRVLAVIPYAARGFFFRALAGELSPGDTRLTSFYIEQAVHVLSEFRSAPRPALPNRRRPLTAMIEIAGLLSRAQAVTGSCTEALQTALKIPAPQARAAAMGTAAAFVYREFDDRDEVRRIGDRLLQSLEHVLQPKRDAAMTKFVEALLLEEPVLWPLTRALFRELRTPVERGLLLIFTGIAAMRAGHELRGEQLVDKGFEFLYRLVETQSLPPDCPMWGLRIWESARQLQAADAVTAGLVRLADTFPPQERAYLLGGLAEVGFELPEAAGSSSAPAGRKGGGHPAIEAIRRLAGEGDFAGVHRALEELDEEIAHRAFDADARVREGGGRAGIDWDLRLIISSFETYPNIYAMRSWHERTALAACALEHGFFPDAFRYLRGASDTIDRLPPREREYHYRLFIEWLLELCIDGP